MKTCYICKIPKEAVEYYKNKISPDGLQARCKACDKTARTKKGVDGLTNSQRYERKKGADGLTNSQRKGRRKGEDGLTYNQRRAREKGGDGLTRGQRKGEDGLTHNQRQYRKRGTDGLTDQQRWQKNNPGVRRDYALKINYGLSLEQFDEMILNQGGMCAICGSEDKLCVDHNHITNKVRQLLCKKCNAALGLLKDSVDIVNAAADYLKKHS